MAEQDFNLVANIIPNKKELERELTDINVNAQNKAKKQNQRNKEQGDDETSSALSDLLGPIKNLVKTVGLAVILFQAFQPFFKVLESFIKVLQLLFVPLNVLLIRLLQPLLENFAAFAERFVNEGLDLVDDLVSAIQGIVPLISEIARFTKELVNLEFSDFLPDLTSFFKTGAVSNAVQSTGLNQGPLGFLSGGPSSLALSRTLQNDPVGVTRRTGNVVRNPISFVINSLTDTELLSRIRGQINNFNRNDTI